ncbi:MAG TPA: hypothetical protein VHX40_09615, partial [Acidimicrobiales bacterium]|nr:hypothetical protein [Acidimicrobiales bacterium]
MVDAGADVAEWDDEVEIVRRWHKTLGLESVALLGWDRVIDASDFLDAPGSYHQSHQARGPVLGIPLLALRESLHPGPARAVVLSATEVLDKPDWDDREWLGWDGLELRFFGVGPNSKEPLVQANQGRVDRFVAGSDRPVADPLVSVAGPSAVSIVRSGPSPQADSPPILQPAPSTLQVAAASGRQPVVFEVVGYDAEETAPSVVRSDGWVLGRLAGPADGGDWQGPTDVGTASLDVLRAFFAGEQYACPREGCGRE